MGKGCGRDKEEERECWGYGRGIGRGRCEIKGGLKGGKGERRE